MPPLLLPTANITNLPPGRVPLATPVYLKDSWLPWILVTAVTLGPLARGPHTPTRTGPNRPCRPRPPRRARPGTDVPDRVAIRALLSTHLALHGSFTSQLTDGTMLACGASNLPAAAAILPAGTPGLWAAILATTIGPNLLITGSVATLITRRIARDAGARLTAWQFSAVGVALVPAQLAAATLGLHITGAL